MIRHRWCWPLVLALVWVLAGCASAPKAPGTATLRPLPQQPPTHQAVGDAIVASLGGAGVTVGWLGEGGVARYFADRPGLVAPWPQEVWKETPPTVFLVRIRNQTREEIQYDPGTATLTNQAGDRERPIPYEEFYLRMAEQPGAAERLRTLQSVLLTRFLVLGPGGQREGFLVFPATEPASKLLVLDIGTFYVGGRIASGLFPFQVTFPEK